MTATVRAALYLRVSTGRQADSDLSIPDQRRQAKGYCESRGWEIVADYVEPGASATDDRRPEFQRMIDAATVKPPAFGVILVHSFSRFFRDQFQFEMLLKTRSPAMSAPRVVSGPTLLTGICFCAACGGAMTLRTGKSGRYRYYTCCTKARQGETGCKGRTVPMEKLDSLVAEHIEHRLSQPKRLEEVLSAVLHRRKERAERRTMHIAELRKRAAEAEAKLKRLYDAIENGIADVSDPMLKERVTELKSIRDQARADAKRAEGALDRAGPSITPRALKTFASQARRRMRTESGGYRRDHLHALAQRVVVGAQELRIMGSKSELLRTLVAASSAKTAGFGVPSSVPKVARHGR
jgi:site-specific DNA recombinase